MLHLDETREQKLKKNNIANRRSPSEMDSVSLDDFFIKSKLNELKYRRPCYYFSPKAKSTYRIKNFKDMKHQEYKQYQQKLLLSQFFMNRTTHI